MVDILQIIQQAQFKRQGNVEGKSYSKKNSMIFLIKKEKEIRLANNFT